MKYGMALALALTACAGSAPAPRIITKTVHVRAADPPAERHARRRPFDPLPIYIPGPEPLEEEDDDDILTKALEEAQRGPNQAFVDRARVEYPWDPTVQYTVYCRPGVSTIIILEPGEYRTEKRIDAAWGGWRPYKEIQLGDEGKLVHAVSFSPGSDAGEVELTLATNLRAIGLRLVPVKRPAGYNRQVRIPITDEAPEPLSEVLAKAAESQPAAAETSKDACQPVMAYTKQWGLGSDPSVSRHAPRWGTGANVWKSCAGSLGRTHVEFADWVKGRALPIVRADCAPSLDVERYPSSNRVAVHLGCLATWVELSYCDATRCEGVTFKDSTVKR